MRLSELLNNDRVNALTTDPNAYVSHISNQQYNQVKSQDVEKVIFPQPYESAKTYYNKNQFSKPEPPQPEAPCQREHHSGSKPPMFDMQSLLPMLMTGKFNDLLKPLMSMMGGGGSSVGGLGDIAKIFELFKPKQTVKKTEPKQEDVSSKFDDMIIIED